MLTSMNAYASMYHLYSFYLYPLQMECCNFNMASEFEDSFAILFILMFAYIFERVLHALRLNYAGKYWHWYL